MHGSSQCDQLTRLFVEYLAIFMHEVLLNIIKYLQNTK